MILKSLHSYRQNLGFGLFTPTQNLVEKQNAPGKQESGPDQAAQIEEEFWQGIFRSGRLTHHTPAEYKEAMTMRFLNLLLAVTLVLTAACSRTRKYAGKDVCALLTNDDIAAIMGEPFQKGSLTRLDDEDDEYIGSCCGYESEARSSLDRKTAAVPHQRQGHVCSA